MKGGVIMARNNIKILSPAQLEKLNAKYYFEVDENDIIVGLNGYQRVTRHPRDKCFHINSRNDVKRFSNHCPTGHFGMDLSKCLWCGRKGERLWLSTSSDRQFSIRKNAAPRVH